MITILDRVVSERIIKAYGSQGIVYDLSALSYTGSKNDPAMYGHYYHTNGGIPVHHRIMPGKIVSVSTVRSFAMELRDLGIRTIMIVMDRGFYSTQNIMDLSDYSLIGAIPASLNIFRDLLTRSRGIEHSVNDIQYREESAVNSPSTSLTLLRSTLYVLSLELHLGHLSWGYEKTISIISASGIPSSASGRFQ